MSIFIDYNILMYDKTQINIFKSGYVAVLGKPNVGKSTLINTLIGKKVNATSPWPQTTRRRQMGIYTDSHAQVIFLDTPGIHRPLHKLGETMLEEAEHALDEADIALVLFDISTFPDNQDSLLVEMVRMAKHRLPYLVVMNKVDLVSEADLLGDIEKYQSLSSDCDSILISATQGDNLDALMKKLIDYLPEGQPFFPHDQLTDLFERDICSDLIREAVLYNLRDEVPHCVAIRIDEFKERDQQTIFISATIFVERDSHKAIIIGAGGETLKKIGIFARKEIEALLESKVYLQTRVKILKNWRNNTNALRLLGYKSKS